MINAFRGRWTRLGNYSIGTVFFEGHAYPSVEHAYQAQKSLDPAVQKMIRDCPTPNTAKQMARKVQLRPDWEQVKDLIMLRLLREKFCQEPERAILLSTGFDQLTEGNWWHDNYWGDCSCGRAQCQEPGKNMLGELLMQVRTELRAGTLFPESLNDQ
jgi:ribA/ribD-fused uncharacterized protein